MKAKILITILVAFWAIIGSCQIFKNSLGIDFFQNWGVSKAKMWSGNYLRSPYTGHIQYAAILNAYANGSNDQRFKRANQFNRKLYQDHLNFFGTPLCYMIFGLMPQNYSLASGIFLIFQIILFITAIVLLSPDPQRNGLGLVLALLLIGIYQPLVTDLSVGNLNSFQLFALVVLTIFADRILMRRSAGSALGPSAIFLCSLVSLTLLKPNLIVVMLLFAACLWAWHGKRVFGQAATVAAVFGAILMALPCIYFGSWTIWQDWYSYLHMGGGRLFPSISIGNYATILLVSQALDISILSTTIGVAATLSALVLIALRMATPPGEMGFKGMWGVVVRSLRDPFLSAAIGITLTLALMPLVWDHYYVISLFPALWLLTALNDWGYVEVLGGLSIILTSGLAALLLNTVSGWPGLTPYSIAIGWVPLWAGVLAVIVRQKKSSSGEPRSPLSPEDIQRFGEDA